MKISVILVFLAAAMMNGCATTEVAKVKPSSPAFAKAHQEAAMYSDCGCVGSGYSTIEDDEQRAENEARAKAQNGLAMCVGILKADGKPTPCAEKDIDSDVQYSYGKDEEGTFAIAFFPSMSK